MKHIKVTNIKIKEVPNHKHFLSDNENFIHNLRLTKECMHENSLRHILMDIQLINIIARYKWHRLRNACIFTWDIYDVQGESGYKISSRSKYY